MTDLVLELTERAASYRLGGPSSEHTALLLEMAANEITTLREVIAPFALVAERDIGEGESDQDFFAPMKEHNTAPRLLVGHFRKAASAVS